jgi:hypothetical protein
VEEKYNARVGLLVSCPNEALAEQQARFDALPRAGVLPRHLRVSDLLHCHCYGGLAEERRLGQSATANHDNGTENRRRRPVIDREQALEHQTGAQVRAHWPTAGRNYYEGPDDGRGRASRGGPGWGCELGGEAGGSGPRYCLSLLFVARGHEGFVKVLCPSSPSTPERQNADESGEVGCDGEAASSG